LILTKTRFSIRVREEGVGGGREKGRKNKKEGGEGRGREGGGKEGRRRNSD